MWASLEKILSMMDPQLIEEQLEEFSEWIKDQPDLPQSFDKINLVRYLKASEFDLEAAQKLFRNSITLRHKNPQIFTQRDPLSPEMQTLIKAV